MEDDGPEASSLVRYAEQRAAGLQNRVADAITGFAGSMGFVYLHVIWFVLWLKVEPFKDVFPYGLTGGHVTVSQWWHLRQVRSSLQQPGQLYLQRLGKSFKDAERGILLATFKADKIAPTDPRSRS